MSKTRSSISLPIRDFALPSPLTGSIEANSGYAQIFGGADKLAGEGRDIHIKIQKERQKVFTAYKAEHKLAHKFEGSKYIFSVSGRADGFVDGVTPTIEEIKSSLNHKELAARLAVDRDHPYRLQLATYAYIVYLERQVVPVTRFLITGNLSDSIEEVTVEFSPADYENWLARRLKELEKQIDDEIKARKRRQDIAQKLVFPFAKPRPGQRELIDDLTFDVSERHQVLIQAPTGLGKTAAVIYPLIQDSLSRGQKLIYVTPKNSQHIGAQEALSHLRETGAPVKALTLNAKAKMCLKDEVICNPSYCQYAKDYYTKVNDNKLLEKTARMKSLTAETFKKLGEKYEVCPFELSLDAVAEADVVVADYNYVFSPRNTLGRFTYSLSKDYEKPNLVIDEAHNLPSRACDYYSKALSSAHIVEQATDLSTLSTQEQIELRAILSEVLFKISEIGRNNKQREAKITLSAELFSDSQAKLSALMIRRLKQKDGSSGSGGSGKGDPILNLANYLSDFKDALSYEGDEFLHLYSRDRKSDMSYDEVLKVVCCDASSKLKGAHQEFQHVAAFSATIKPFKYFAQLSGFEEAEVSYREYFSPFPKENRKLLVIPQVSTKYSDRERNYDKIAQAIVRLASLKAGNYFAFFPSFAFSNAVFARVSKLLEDADKNGGIKFKLLKQDSEISQAKSREILDALTTGTPTLVFAVQGGVFAEGVDYPGEMIIGAFIVGPGLPNFNFEREKIREYYDKRYGNGFDYAYVFPAMAKVIQAAGRVIRSDTDCGIIVLMDKRFTEDTYVTSMPSDWVPGGVNGLVSSSLVNDISSFWQSWQSK